MITATDTQAALDQEEAHAFRQLTGRLVAAVRQHQGRRVELRAALKAARKLRKQADENLSLFLEGFGSRDELPDLEFLGRLQELTRAAEAAQEADSEARQEYALAVSNTRRAQLELRLACSRRFARAPLFEWAAAQQQPTTSAGSNGTSDPLAAEVHVGAVRMPASEVQRPRCRKNAADPAVPKIGEPGRCTVCGCSETDCRSCIARIGHPCSWVDSTETLCTACAPLLEAHAEEALAGRGGLPDPRKLEAAGIVTVNDLLELDDCKPPLGLNGGDTMQLRLTARDWLHEQLRHTENGEPLDQSPPAKSLGEERAIGPAAEARQLTTKKPASRVEATAPSRPNGKGAYQDVEVRPGTWIKLHVSPDGTADAFCDFGKLGNWHESTLPEGAVYWPDADELSEAVSKAAGKPMRLRDWGVSKDERLHELRFIPADQAPGAKARRGRKKKEAAGG